MARSAAVLNRQHLGKQRVETYQIMIALLEGRGWIHHPVTKMWAGYEWALLHYQKAVCTEWHLKRGYDDTCMRKTFEVYVKHRGSVDAPNRLPPWYGNKEFHLSHKSNLLRKDPEHYGDYFPGVPNNLTYVYPKARS